ncbi:hypothetical protein [Sediminibacterium sp.]|uniref:hypothetical protein n=1 Tax=Sediminibacterium sp. TaxID=1917865 RepID=UPI003F6A4647
MKSLLSISILCTLMIIHGCKPSQPERSESYSTAISIISDKSDPHLLQPNSKEIIGRLLCTAYPDKRVVVRLRSIEDLVMSHTEVLLLKSEIETEGSNRFHDNQHRNKVIREFYRAITNAIDSCAAEPQTKELPLSECFKTIVTEIIEIKTTDAIRKELWIFSNLSENRPGFSAYNSRASSDSIATLLVADKAPPDSLNGITLVFAYRPSDRDDDIRFMKMAKAYQLIFETRGAKVIIQSHNKATSIE